MMVITSSEEPSIKQDEEPRLGQHLPELETRNPQSIQIGLFNSMPPPEHQLTINTGALVAEGGLFPMRARNIPVPSLFYARGNPDPLLTFTRKIVNVADLKQMRDNPKKHPSWQIEKLIQSLQSSKTEEPKLLQAICIDEENTVLIGNGRLQAITQLGWKKVEVNVLEGLTPDEKKTLAILDNKSISLEWDEQLLARTLPKLSDKGFETGFTEKEIRDIVAKTTSLAEIEEPAYDMSPRLYEKYNYILLFFENEIDFLYASQVFGLEKMKDRMKPTKVGLYRAVRGMDALKKIRETPEHEIPSAEPTAK